MTRGSWIPGLVHRRTVWAVILAVAGLGTIRGQEPASDRRVPPPDTLPAELVLDAVPLGLGPRPIPDSNPLTAERVTLGRRLFFEPRLSSDGSLSCASCHDPRHAFTTSDARAVGFEGKVNRRNAPTILNRALGGSFFWDGRADSLEKQAIEPIENPLELHSTLPDVLARLSADPTYVAQFQAAFGEGPITADHLGRAIASFERTLVSANSPIDRFQAENAKAVSDEARLGLWVFESKGQCWHCHSGPNYSDESFHNTGVSWNQTPLDLGRFEITGQESDRGAFKTPTLREVARTAPYMHDGGMATLRDVVEFYNRGGIPNPNRDARIKPLNLTPLEIDYLIAFLQNLSGELPTRP